MAILLFVVSSLIVTLKWAMISSPQNIFITRLVLLLHHNLCSWWITVEYPLTKIAMPKTEQDCKMAVRTSSNNYWTVSRALASLPKCHNKDDIKSCKYNFLLLLSVLSYGRHTNVRTIYWTILKELPYLNMDKPLYTNNRACFHITVGKTYEKNTNVRKETALCFGSQFSTQNYGAIDNRRIWMNYT